MTDRMNQLLAMYEKDPSDSFCTYAIAMEAAKLGRVAEAIGYLDKTIQLDADQAYAFYHKARLQLEEGLPDEAKQTLIEGVMVAKRTGDEKAQHELEDLGRLIEE